MMETLTASIIQTVKDELQESGDLTSTELYDLLYKYRNSQHPDKFFDEERKRGAEEKFKKLNSLLVKLAKYIEEEKQQKRPSDMILYEKEYEIIRNKQEIIKYQATIENLQFTKEMNEREIIELKKQILKLQGDKVDEKTDDLIKHYKPSKNSLLSQGITFILTLIIGAITKIDDVAIILSKYFPFDLVYLNYFIFGVLLFIPIRFLKMYFEEGQIENTAKRIKTPLFINKFLNYITDKGFKDTFAEMDVYEFLSMELAPRNIFTKLFRKNIFDLYDEATIDSLKDIYIYNLLNKQLISISNADQLDRKFKIAKTSYYHNFSSFNIP
ncbi:hypothetical protein [Flavobacterium sharifuzzamanii]|uniref:hypothetical protein n=1 Tax=Flavobacterium sharifuzzamanii TaxID=2211133 RepID=UPI001300A4C7|nr:hypothetical protein [Flavobacterium sharifuzzamanii]KAF2082030.1 hypothetical protein DMA14_06050 [Flavobacterium sharifuzzamanii]